jgi:hypothetical protein
MTITLICLDIYGSLLQTMPTKRGGTISFEFEDEGVYA